MSRFHPPRGLDHGMQSKLKNLRQIGRILEPEQTDFDRIAVRLGELGDACVNMTDDRGMNHHDYQDYASSPIASDRIHDGENPRISEMMGRTRRSAENIVSWSRGATLHRKPRLSFAPAMSLVPQNRQTN